MSTTTSMPQPIDPFLCREQRSGVHDVEFCCAGAHLETGETLLRLQEEAMLLATAHRRAAAGVPELDHRPFMHGLVWMTRQCLELSLKLVLEQQGTSAPYTHDLSELAEGIDPESWLWQELDKGTITAFHRRSPRATEDRYPTDLGEYCCVSITDIEAVLDAANAVAMRALQV